MLDLNLNLDLDLWLHEVIEAAAETGVRDERATKDLCHSICVDTALESQ